MPDLVGFQIVGFLMQRLILYSIVYKSEDICPILHRLGMESEETTSTEINNPGAYSTVCVELDVASLAVNTIIEVSLK